VCCTIAMVFGAHLCHQADPHRSVALLSMGDTHQAHSARNRFPSMPVCGILHWWGNVMWGTYNARKEPHSTACGKCQHYVRRLQCHTGWQSCTWCIWPSHHGCLSRVRWFSFPFPFCLCNTHKVFGRLLQQPTAVSNSPTVTNDYPSAVNE
jgi:hypothetical protein